MKKQINIRVSDLTEQQLDALAARWGTSITETVTVLVGRAYQKETATMYAHSLDKTTQRAAVEDEGLVWPVAEFELVNAPQTPTPVNPVVYEVVRAGWAMMDADLYWFEVGNTTRGYEFNNLRDPAPFPGEVKRVLAGDFDGMVYPVMHPTERYRPSTPRVTKASVTT